MAVSVRDGVTGRVPVPPSPGRTGLARRRGRVGLWYVAPWAIGFVLWYLVPMLASLWFSFTDYNLVSGEPPAFNGLDNWTRLVADPEIRSAAVVTLKYGLLSLPFAIGVPIGLAYLLVSKNLRFRNAFRMLFFMPSVIPFVAAVLLFGGIMNGQTGWVNRLLSLVGISGPNWFQDETWVYPALMFIGLWGVGNAMIIFIASMNSVPATLYDAATIDGAGQLALFRHVTLPMISPVIFYNVVIALIGLFNYFLVPFVLTNGSGEPNGSTLFYPMYFFRVGFRLFDMGYAATIAWALFLVAIIVTGALFWSARYWVHYEFEE
jgi:ABC-type sugar transport system permease subunit